MKELNANEKKYLQKKRMISYFLNATLEIIEGEGIEKVTIRKVSDIAGYNSATLYNYFENLDHLLFFAAMHHLNAYIDALPTFIKRAQNSKEIYLSVWHCFMEFAFMKPDIFYNLFFSRLTKEMDSYIDQYYALYPLDIKSFPVIIRKMLSSTNISTRSKILMNQCIEEGFFTQENGYLIDDMVILLFESMLMRVYLKSIGAGTAKELLLYYIDQLFVKLQD